MEILTMPGQDLEWYLENQWHRNEIIQLYLKLFNIEPSMYDVLELWEEYQQWFDSTSPDPKRRYAFHVWLRHIKPVKIWKF